MVNVDFTFCIMDPDIVFHIYVLSKCFTVHTKCLFGSLRF
jgi:hypothetical protein